MKLYEINQEILDLLNQLEPDPETGEVPMNEEELLQQLHAMMTQREDVLQYLAKTVLNMRAEEAALKSEETRLKERRANLQRSEDRLMSVLMRECPENTDLGVAAIRYRRTEHLEVTDCEKAIRWLKRKKLAACYRVPEPEIAKDPVRRLINAGTQVPGCRVVVDRSCSLK